MHTADGDDGEEKGLRDHFHLCSMTGTALKGLHDAKLTVI